MFIPPEPTSVVQQMDQGMVIELVKESREKAGGRVQKRLKLCVSSQAKSEGLQIKEEAVAVFEKEDPNTGRSSKVKGGGRKRKEGRKDESFPDVIGLVL
jgi:hypothetical protein